MLEPLDLGVLRDFATALLIGALVGVEREKRKAEEGDRGIAGLRTFILVALIGAVAGYLARAAGLSWLAARSPAAGGSTGPRRLRGHGPGTAGIGRPHHRARGARGLPARRDDDAGPPRSGDRARRGDGRRAGLQAAAARARREARLGRRLCRGPAADRHLHHPAVAARPRARSVAGAQSLQALAAGDPDLQPVARRLRGDPLARRRAGHGGDRASPAASSPRPR